MKTYRRIGAAEKTLRLLEYLVESEAPAKVRDIADHLKMTESNALSYLATLEDDGYARHVNGGWKPGISISLIRRKIKQRLLSETAEISKRIDLINAQEEEAEV